MKKTLLLAVAAAGILTLAASTNAGEPFMSPKAKAAADSLRRVPGTTPDLIDRSVKAGSPKGLAFAESRRRVPNIGPTVDWVHAPRPMRSPKDPRFQTAWRSNAVKEFQVAPLK
jgi:hypothetical protein